ncbi:MAG: LysM peptidoglycan-binding protein [Paenibacillaceae bacterium]|jgi:hypothetical protein|nr:LysM peptidoglycan-binding protein [Paenibacillaceae bacterium]
MDAYSMTLTYNNQEEGFDFPILPGKIEVSGKGDGAEYEVYGLGKINVIKSPGLAELSIESIFPSQVYPFMTAKVMYEPQYYVDLIEKWRQTKHPVRFVYSGVPVEINLPVSIESFEWAEVGGEGGDIQFSLGLKEYRFYAAVRAWVTDGAVMQDPPKRADERIFPLAYTVIPGDTLWTISKTIFGTTGWKDTIKAMNGLTDEQAKNLPVGMVLKLPKLGGGRARAGNHSG